MDANGQIRSAGEVGACTGHWHLTYWLITANPPKDLFLVVLLLSLTVPWFVCQPVAVLYCLCLWLCSISTTTTTITLETIPGVKIPVAIVVSISVEEISFGNN